LIIRKWLTFWATLYISVCVAGGRGGGRHTAQTAARLRRGVSAAKVPDVVSPEHEHGSRAGNGTVQQTAADDPVESAERAQSHQRIRGDVRRAGRSGKQRPQGD